MTNTNHDHGLRLRGSTMNKQSLGLTLVLSVAGALALGGAGCSILPQVNRVQTNLIDKSVFEGDWWYTRTVIQLDDDAAYAVGAAGSGAPWAGAMSNYDISSNSGVIGRIRWVIDENFIYAYRATEIIPGSNADAREPTFRGSPLAVYRIQAHVDVRQEYNTGTGEALNVVSENTTDRRWYDRRFVRVDWSQNLVSFGQFGDSLEIAALFGDFRRESAPLGIHDRGTSSHAVPGIADLPAAWAPQLVRVADDATYRFRDEWPADRQDTVHYMSFVTQEIWTPLQCFGSACGTSIAITTRDAFLRVPPNHEYAVETLANSEYDRFGIIRTQQRTYLRGGLDRSQLAEHCRTNADCSTNSCDMARHVCVGGLTDELGETDFLTYYRLRHNFYRNSFRHDGPNGGRVACTSDWQCSGRFSDQGRTDPTTHQPIFDGVPGSICDQAAHVCTLPLAQRDIRQVAYYLSPGYPTYLLRSAFELVGQWNEVFMRGSRALHGRAAPTGSPIACQGDNPTDYCFCSADRSVVAGEVDAMTMTCPYQVNGFQSVQDQLAHNVTNPYNCWIESPRDVAHPASFQDYDRSWTGLRFTSDPSMPSECMLTLRVNSCDVDPTHACEQLGDIRYNMFNYVTAAASGFCGVMQPMQDPVNGEAIVSPINMGGQCLDNFGVQPLEWWPILRGEPGIDDVLSGDEVRRYFAALGTVHEPIGIAPGADPGFAPAISDRPALPADLHSFYLDQVAQNLGGASQLHGPEGRAMLYSGRLARLAGSPLERRYAEASASEGFPAPNAIEHAATAALSGPGVIPRHMNFDDPTTMERMSPSSARFLDHALADFNRERELMNHGSCMMMERPALVYTSQFGEYWANAFRGVPLAEARVRWAQAWHRAVMQHELGHGLGLEHNFAATLDRDNYLPGYYNIALRDADRDGQPDLVLPRLQDFDADHNQQITGDEQTRWLQRMQEVRHQRNRAGAGNYMASSTMDYPGDLSDIMGIGLYDRAAVYFNYFNSIEAYDDHCMDANGNGRLEAGECRTPGDVAAVRPASPNYPQTSAQGILRSDQFSRQLIPWYRGGDRCTADAECPFSSVGAGQGHTITQRCVTNPRYSTIPLPCGTMGSDATHCICSTIDSDFVDYVDGNAYRRRQDGQEIAPVRYLFCSNPRLNDISWCNTFDAGENFQEVIANWRSEWQSRYLTSYFRRHQRRFYTGPRTARYIPDAAKIYQHLLFRLIYEPRFTTNTGPLGFDDQYAASIDAMNWFAELATLPDPGSYQLDRTIGANGAFVHMGETPGMPGADLSLDVGQGYYHWSRYQDGELGFFRMERVGTFWDKRYALQALARRDWGLRYTVDERYYINFFSFFPVEMTELFGGIILDNDDWYAPRVRTDAVGGTSHVQYVNWYRAPDLYGRGCRSATGVTVPCRRATPVEFPNPVIQGTSDDILRYDATYWALAQFPVFYDNSWERRLSIFALGSGDGFTIPDTQRDGTQTCAYATSVLASPTHRGGCSATAADYITYTSDHLHTTYVAVKVRSRATYNLEEEQLGFQFLLALNTNQELVRSLALLETAGTITAAQRTQLARLRTRITRDESFIGTLIQLQRRIGINSYL